jgi:uncharacterized damage-inducible protein DinB
MEYFAQRPSFFGSIHATLNHILIVDLTYLGRIEGEERVQPDCTELCSDFLMLRTRQQEVDREIIRFTESQSESTLEASVSFRMSSGRKYTEKVARILSHLFVHQIHHRGQVHDLFSQTAVPAPQLDEFFLAGDLPFRTRELDEIGLPQE